MKCSYRIFSTTCLMSLLPLLVIFATSLPLQSPIGGAIRESQAGNVLQVNATPTISAGASSSFNISLAELGYDEKTLADSSDATEYGLPLPETWQVREGSYFDLDVSYVHDDASPLATPLSGAANQVAAGQDTTISATQSLPARLGDIVVTVDGQTQLVFPITASTLEHRHLNVPLPLSALNDPTRSTHTVKVSLDASLICNIPHKARLIIHPTSYFLLLYDQSPVAADLARYPRPFYHQGFEPDQVEFVLPDSPTVAELSGAMAIAAKLGNMTSHMVISGTADLDLMSRIGANEPPRQHLFIIGKPEDNQVISELGRMGALPISLRERQLALASEGPAMVVPGGDLTYTLTVTNTSQGAVSSLSLVDMLPAQAQVVSCSPVCSQTTKEEVIWPIPSLKEGASVRYTLKLKLGQVFSDTAVENTVTLLNATSDPINVGTLTATVSAVPQPVSGQISRLSNAHGYFFGQGERAVPEGDGIVQEVASPWDQTRAILVITGLTDEAVYKASRAMSSKSHFPGMEGAIALVRELRPMPELITEPPASDRSFAELGYDDRTLQGVQDSTYYFDIPLGWSLTEKAYLDLHFRHSQLIDYSRSSLNVLLNNQPIAGISLSDATASAGDSKIPLPASVTSPGQRNKISIRVEMQPADNCADRNMLWLLISRASTLHLDHSQEGAPSLSLDFYPYPFNRQPNLTDVLFVLPPKTAPQEWVASLQLVAALGRAADSNSFAPALALADAWPEAKSDYHLIAIGRPSRNSLLQQVNAQLPQPFLPGSDAIEQRLNDVILRLPPNVDLGYLQLLSSPWNAERAFLAVTGTSDKGVGWAVHLLTDHPREVGGNLTMARAEQIYKIDTRLLTHSGLDAAVGTAVPELTPVAAISTPASFTPDPTPAGRLATAAAPADRPERTGPTWLIPLVAVTLIAVLAIFAIAIMRARHQTLDKS